VYKLKEIAGKCWMNQDLNYGTLLEVYYLPNDDTHYEKYCEGDLLANCQTKGASYMWHEAMGFPAECIDKNCNGTPPLEGGLCPSGMRLPTNSEWQQLATTLNALGNPQNTAISLGWIWSSTELKWAEAFMDMGPVYWTGAGGSTTATLYQISYTEPYNVVSVNSLRHGRSASVRCVKI
jgi:uncharacterized protein (TIGR02145 family)